MTTLRIGNGYDVHALAEGLTFRIGGVTIPHHKGCVAHSDGDVLIHALCDALLGAAALGDIGLHFPDTSPEYKGIDSLKLLERTMELLTKEGYRVVNADTTILLQIPKIKPYITLMCETLSAAMDISPQAISVKATTTERLGFVGREEGVAAYAVVLITK